MSSLTYRPEIDGLRALAVVPVVLFHSGISWFSGGYVGVDIFFVISGYLITRILVNDIQKGTFSIARFYERRIRRIFPALLFVLLVSSLVAYYVFFPGELRRFKDSVQATLLFYSNYFFMFDVGYFADSAESKPLLHTWSLAVEEQFYVVFPIILYLLYRYLKKYLFSAITGILLLSFAYSVLLVQSNANDAFYSTPARAWELLIGSFLVLLEEKKKLVLSSRSSNVLSFTGLVMILVSVLTFTEHTSFPGPSALLPVIGSALIIFSANSNANWTNRLLSLQPIRFIGLISYSLYLWHWPVLVFYKTYQIQTVEEINLWIVFSVMLLLSLLSWKFVEKPFRKLKVFNKNTVYKITQLSAGVVLVYLVIFVFVFSDFKRDLPKEVRASLSSFRESERVIALEDCESERIERIFTLKICYVGNLKSEVITFAVLGDSHSRALLAGIDESARRNGKKGIYIGSGGCIPFVDMYRTVDVKKDCQRMVTAYMGYLRQKHEIEDVILAARWSLYATGKRYRVGNGKDIIMKDDSGDNYSIFENRNIFEKNFQKTMSLMQEMNKRVSIVTQVPEMKWGARQYARAQLTGKEFDFRETVVKHQERQNLVTHVFTKYQKKYGYDIIQPDQLMCPDEYCIFEQNGRPIYSDNNHIMMFFSKQLSPLYDDIFQNR